MDSILVSFFCHIEQTMITLEAFKRENWKLKTHKRFNFTFLAVVSLLALTAWSEKNTSARVAKWDQFACKAIDREVASHSRRFCRRFPIQITFSGPWNRIIMKFCLLQFGGAEICHRPTCKTSFFSAICPLMVLENMAQSISEEKKNASTVSVWTMKLNIRHCTSLDALCLVEIPQS